MDHYGPRATHPAEKEPKRCWHPVETHACALAAGHEGEHATPAHAAFLAYCEANPGFATLTPLGWFSAGFHSTNAR